MTRKSPSPPLYFLIRNLIKKRILEGTYPAGSKIPGEIELSKEFKVHRLTIRAALSVLVKEKYLVRFRKRGTFVGRETNAFDNLEITGFFEELFDQFAQFKAKKVNIVHRQALPIITDLFRLNQKKDKITIIQRQRFLGDIPAAYAISYLPFRVGKYLHKNDFHQMPLIKILKEKLKIPLEGVSQTIELTVAENDVADILKIPFGTAVLLIERTFFTKNESPIAFIQTFYRGDKFRFFIKFQYGDHKDHLQLKN